jgi:GTP-binding protein YchF
MVKQGNKDLAVELELLKRMSDVLNEGKPARLVIKNEDEQKIANGYFLLTTKPVIYACNVSENDLATPEEELKYVNLVKEFAKTENSKVLVVCAKIEQELSELEEDEKQMFLEDLGLTKSGLEKVIQIGYETLGQISYLTAGEKEVRAWTIVKGTKAPGAAGKIHTDFEKGFIKADVVSYANLVEFGGYNQAKEAGKVRSEGKDYVVQDGDVILFKFNV